VNTALSVSPVNVVIENVELISSPQSGQVTMQGRGFSYTAKSNFHGEDSFTVVVSGVINRMPGSSTIRVDVSVVGAPSVPVSPATHVRLPAPAAASQSPTIPATERTPSLPAGASPLSTSMQVADGMTWKTLKIGAGGFISGIDMTADGTKVIRTDTYGAYTWDARASTWIQLLTINSMPATDSRLGTGIGVYEIAIAPSNSQRFYMMYNGYVFRTDNRGATWTRTAFTQVTSSDANDAYRGFGHKMAVDPQNADIVLVGTETNGLFYSMDAGASWRAVAAVTTASAVGIIVAFDPSSGVSEGRKQGIYASSYGTGVYHTTTGPSGTWTLTTGTPRTHQRMTVGSDGVVYLTGNDNDNNIHIFSSGSWSTVSVGSQSAIVSVSVDPSNAARVVAVNQNGNTSVSVNHGATWTGYASTERQTANDIPWLTFTNGAAMFPGDIMFDPSASNVLFQTAGLGVWTASPSNSNTTIAWLSQSTGIEQLVANWIISPPGGNPLVTAWDRAVFAVTNPEVYPSKHGTTNDSGGLSMGWSADWASASPSTIVVLANWFGGAAHETSGYSEDGGVTWKQFTSKSYALNGNLGGQIAASTSTNFVILQTDNGSKPNQPYYTTDGGSSWHAITIAGLPTSGATGWVPNYYQDNQILCADRVDANTFYLYNFGSAGAPSAIGVYKSTDGGATWSHVYKNGFSGATGLLAKMRSVPGQAGNLFFTLGKASASAFQRSTDHGATWSAVKDVTEVWAFGFGKAAPGRSYPAIYIAGYVRRVWGIYRSIDNAVSWTKIGDFPLNSFDEIKAIEGDANVYGTVYVGFRGSGFAYGRLNFLLAHDLDPSNDNTPVGLQAVG
jgi:hypothetical protein